jgi:hypothetical protein
MAAWKEELYVIKAIALALSFWSFDASGLVFADESTAIVGK